MEANDELKLYSVSNDCESVFAGAAKWAYHVICSNSRGVVLVCFHIEYWKL